MSTTTKIDLLLLGMLLDRPMHGYELYQQIQADGIDLWFNISMASVYYSLGKLRDQGCVVESRQRGGRSVRKSIYRLTEDGRRAFLEAMEAQAISQEKVYLDYDVIICLLNRIPLKRALPWLQVRQSFLANQVQEMQSLLAAEGEGNGSSPKLAVLDHRLRYYQMEHRWLTDVIQDIQGQGRDNPQDTVKRAGLMTLRGDLRHHHLPDLLRLIISGEHSGTLAVTDGVQVRSLSFEDGQPVSAIVRRNDQASAPELTTEEVMEAVCDLFRWQEGKFTFDPRQGRDDRDVSPSLSAEDLILAGCRWVDNWTIIQRLVPSADMISEREIASKQLGGLRLTQLEKRIMDAVDGVKDVATIADELGVTLFEASRAFYCLMAVGILRAADLDKIRLRRVFREIAELMCSSTVAWRSSPSERTCEQEVNQLTEHLPLCITRGRIEDQADPQLRTEELVQMYREFLLTQLDVVSRSFGRENACQSFERTLRQLAPELQGVAEHYDFDTLLRQGDDPIPRRLGAG